MTTSTTVRLFVANCLLLVLAGCGQSGPLYIPGNPSTIQTPPPPPAETREEDDDESTEPTGP